MNSTRKDVALKAGVSEATVSNVIGKLKPVSKEMERRVREAATILNYRPNSVARSLATNKTKHIIMIVDNMRNPHYNEILEGAQKLAYSKDYLLSVVPLSITTQDTIVELISRKVDGAILTVDKKHVEKYLSLNFPTVTMDECVDLNLKLPIFEMVKRLHELGHKKIAFLSGLELDYTTHLRYHYFLDAMDHYKLNLDNKLIISGNYVGNTDEFSGEKAMEELFKRNVDFTAVFAVNDLMAIGAAKVIRKRGMTIPTDISLVGFDNTKFSEYFVPTLSTFDINTLNLGTTLMEVLIDKMNGKEIKKKYIESKFIERESIGLCKENILLF